MTVVDLLTSPTTDSQLSADAMGRLVNFKGEFLHIQGPYESLLAIDGYAGGLALTVSQLHSAEAKVLTSYSRRLYLDILPDDIAINMEAVDILNSHADEMWIEVDCHKRRLPVEVVGCLSRVNADITFEKLKELTDENAELLSQHSGRLVLNEVTELSSAAGHALARHDGPVECKSLVETAKESMAEARSLRDACEYDQAIAVLTEIPEVARPPKHHKLLIGIQSKQAEAKRLVAEIKSRIKKNKLNDLLPLVERACVLLKHRDDLQVVKKQLIQRMQKSPDAT